MNKVFSFDAPAFEIIKSYRDGNGQMFLEGLAATTNIDLTGERMSPQVLGKMAANLVGKPLKSEHGKGWDDKIGLIQEADVRDIDGQPGLWIKAKLNDWSSKARDLFAFLSQEGSKMGLSVAGKINPGGLVKELVEGLGKWIPTYRDVEPTEVSVTDHPANLDTFAYAVAKSLGLADDDTYDPAEFSKSDRPATIADLAQLATAVANEFEKAAAKKCMKCGGMIGSLNRCEKCGEMYAEMYDASADQTTDDAQKKDPGVTNASDKKPKEYADVPENDFLDPENHKYPADEKHLMPALRYFNHEGQREAGGYEDAKWAAMGRKLATKLSKLTGDSYKYDPSSEKVTKEGVKKNDDTKEVNDEMNNKHGNLVSKNIPDDIKELAKRWGKDLDAEMSVKKSEETKAEDVKKAEAAETKTVEKDSKPELFTPAGDSSSTDTSTSSSDSSSGSDSSSSDSDTTSSTSLSSEMESLVSELKSTLEAIKDSLSTSSSDSDSSDSGSSDSSTDTSDKTSTDKAMDASSTSSESSSEAVDAAKTKKTADADEIARAVDSLVQAANTMRAALEKAKSKNKPNLKDQEDEAASDYSTSDNVTGDVESRAAAKSQPRSGKYEGNGTQDAKAKGAKPKLKDESSEEASDYSSSDNASSPVSKSIEHLTEILGKFEKSLAKRDEEFSKLVEKTEETPNRKGFSSSWALEKNFEGYHDADAVEGVDPVMLKKISEDKEVTWAEYYKYKTYGQLPKKYAVAKA